MRVKKIVSKDSALQGEKLLRFHILHVFFSLLRKQKTTNYETETMKTTRPSAEAHYISRSNKREKQNASVHPNADKQSYNVYFAA